MNEYDKGITKVVSDLMAQLQETHHVLKATMLRVNALEEEVRKMHRDVALLKNTKSTGGAILTTTTTTKTVANKIPVAAAAVFSSCAQTAACWHGAHWKGCADKILVG